MYAHGHIVVHGAWYTVLHGTWYCMEAKYGDQIRWLVILQLSQWRKRSDRQKYETEAVLVGRRHLYTSLVVSTEANGEGYLSVSVSRHAEFC